MWTNFLPEAGGCNLMFLPEAGGGGQKSCRRRGPSMLMATPTGNPLSHCLPYNSRLTTVSDGHTKSQQNR